MEEGKFGTLTKEELERLLDLSECAMFTAYQGADLKLGYANKKFYRILQYTPEEFKEEFQNCLMQVIVPEEKQKIRALIARQSAAGGKIHLEFRVIRKDGAIRWMSMAASVVNVDGQNIYYCSCINITQQKRNLQEVYDAKKEMDLITNSVPGGVVKIRMNDFCLLYANDGFFRLAGYSRTEYFSLFGNHTNKVIHPDDISMVQRMVGTALRNRGVLGFEYRIINKSGETRWSYVNGYRIDDDAGSAVYLCIIMDITARKELEGKIEDNLRRSEHFLRCMKESEWTYLVKENKLIQNGYMEEDLYEREVEDPFSEEELLRVMHPEDIGMAVKTFHERLEKEGQSCYFARLKGENGNYSPNEIYMISVDLDHTGTPDRIYGKMRVLDDESYLKFRNRLPEEKGEVEGAFRQKAADRVLELAKEAMAKHEDGVTHTMGHAELFSRVTDVLDQRKPGENYALLCCDINSFQRITYHYGVSCSTEILQRLAQLLLELSYENICSRVNGDYFVVFSKYESHAELLKTMSRLMLNIGSVEEELGFATQGTTTGIYLVQEEDKGVEEVIQKADLARRSIKGTPGNHYAIFTEELQKNQFIEEEIIRDIGASMRNHSVEICYLPRVRGDKDHVIGCKAVPLIQRKNGSYLPLDDLRRYIDRSNDVQQLVFYVLQNVCTNQGIWKSRGHKIMPVSLDITAGQLCTSNAVNRIDEIVSSNNMEPKDILFEIQEQYFAETSEKFQMALRDLRGRGYRIIISRFGSHHTAVAAIRRLPIHAIKFHGEYFRGNITDEKEITIMRKIVEMAKELGMETSCGGINTQLQDEFAKKIGCDIFEGDMYYGAVRSDVYEKCFLKQE